MIGLVALTITGVYLSNWAQVLGIVPYVLSKLNKRKLVLPAFYIYVIGVILTTKPTSIYSFEGLFGAILLPTTTFLVLDDTLRGGIKFEKNELLLGLLLAVSALNPTTLVMTITGVSLGIARLRFGKTAKYLYGWVITTATFLYIGKSMLQAPSAQALVIAGLSLMLPVVVDFIEVRGSL